MTRHKSDRAPQLRLQHQQAAQGPDLSSHAKPTPSSAHPTDNEELEAARIESADLRRRLRDLESLNREMMLQAILSIQAGDNPRITLDKMMAFLPAVARSKLKTASA